MDKIIPTLKEYLIRHLTDHPDQKDLVMIMSDLSTIGKYISRETNRAGLVGILGTTGLTNVQGEEVAKLDILANDRCKAFLKQTGHFAALASEEEEGVVDMGGYGEEAKYVIAFDPLDGSSNIDVNVSIGTIFSVHKRLYDMGRTDGRQFLQKGREQVLAGYILYGSSTVLVFSFGDGVCEFTLDQGIGEFLLSNERVIVPDICKIYSVNESYTQYFSCNDREFIEHLKNDKKCSTRYIGSLVADFHRNLIKGGIFMYPGVDKEGRGEYKGKLRLNYEAKPMAYLLEQAGGLAVDGVQNILDIEPKELHQRVPLIMGNSNVVEEYLQWEEKKCSPNSLNPNNPHNKNSMSNPNYYDATSAQGVEDLVKTVCSVEGDRVVSITDQEKLQNELIYRLQFNASVNENEEVKKSAISWISKIAEAMRIIPSSNTEFYNKKANGEHEFFTVPAINARMVAFNMARAAIKASESLGLPHVIFELALSEAGYTGQKKDEYAALIKAAYISLGKTDTKIYIQADHYQLDPKKYEANRVEEIQRVKDAIVLALENGVYNIDIDTSKFETDDSSKSDRENQAENARLTAELVHFIREYEKEHNLPCTVSIGGEVGEVGGENTRYPQVNAYLEALSEELRRLGSFNVNGLSKVSINVGSAHGGVLGPDGKPLDSVPLDFTAHHDLYMLAKDSLNYGKHVLSVQHGASTLPKHYFALFPAMHVAEVHLATGFQNIVWDVLEKEDNSLYENMKQMVFDKFGDKVSKHKTEAIGFIKERKRVTEFVKRDLLTTQAIDKIEDALEAEFAELFHSLYTILQPKKGIVVEGDRAD